MSNLDLDRERVIQALCAHYANDNLSTQELEVRFDRAYQAVSLTELQSLLASLPDLPDTVAPPAPLYGTALPRAVQEQERRQLVLMSEVKKRGAWTPARRTVVRTIMGSALFDLREARFPSGVVEFDVVVVMGEVRFLLPPGVVVEAEGDAIMGRFDHQHTAPSESGAPTIRIRGRALMGSVEVKTRLPGESALAAWRRRTLSRGDH
ncbi:MAG: DUF1707 and DUF2154 domain-containing protein [Gemmatimonadetes bacterium]|nr:DUF1707 and DUF2154 domain-containing protein [Gemmatimonadota bacterium]